MLRVLGNVLCDLHSEVEGQIMYFLVNESLQTLHVHGSQGMAGTLKRFV